MRAERSGDPAPLFDARDLMDGAALLAGTANVVMQLAQPPVGYGVLESKVESGQVMRHPVRRARTTVTYLSVAFLGTSEERGYFPFNACLADFRLRRRYHALTGRFRPAG